MKDVGHFMLKKYKSMSFADFNPLWTLENQGRFVYKYEYFEILLAKPNAWIMARTLYFENKLYSKFAKTEDIELSLESG